MKHIVAMGGGGFGGETSNHKIDEYVLKLTQKSRPKVCFLPQASAEDQNYIVRFFDTYNKLGAEPSWISLFGRVKEGWKEQLLAQDVIYVGGGNTKSMIALWKAWGLDQFLQQAYEKGIIMTGISAGGICWFEQGITDSVWPLGTIDALGFLEGSFCPHFDSEGERQEVYRNKVNSGVVKPGLALEDKVAAYFIDGQLHQIIAEIEGKKAIQLKKGQEEILQPITLI